MTDIYLTKIAAGNDVILVRPGSQKVSIVADFLQTFSIAAAKARVVADFLQSFSIQGVAAVDAGTVPASRVVVFTGGSRVVTFGGGTRVVTFDVPWAGQSKGPNMTNAPAPYFRDGKWWVDKDPDEQSFYVANITKELADRGTTATTVEPVVEGVEILIQPQIQGNFVVIKLGGLDVAAGAENFWTARVTCANGERFDRTMHFNRVDN